MTRFELQHQQQPTDHTCGQTCIAMLLGVPVEKVTAIWGECGMTRAEVYHALERCCCWWNAFLFDLMTVHGHYLVTVPSLNNPGGLHYVVVRRDEDGERVFDPQRGRPGKLFYGEGGQPIHGRSGLIYVAKPGWGGNWYGGALPEADPKPGPNDSICHACDGRGFHPTS